MNNPHTPPAASFHGYLDSVKASVARGWAIDLGRRDRPCQVDIYADGAFVARIAADEARADLDGIYGGGGRHGFSFELPLSLADGRLHQVSVRFSETGRDIGGSPATAEVSPLRGQLDRAGAGAISGWASNLLNPNGPCWVDIRVDNIFLARILAGEPRLDLKNSLGASGKHAFTFELPLSFVDGRTHAVSVRFGDTGKELEGSPATIAATDVKAAPLLIRQEFTADLLREASVYQKPGVGSAAMRMSILAPESHLQWTTAAVEAGPDGPSRTDLAFVFDEPAAVAMSIPRARIYRWDGFSTGPGRILDASFQSAPISGYPMLRQVADEYFLDRSIASPTVDLDRDVVHLFRPGAYNHYHWLLEVLPQIWALRQMPFAHCPILVNEASFRTGRKEWEADRAVKLECLDALGFPSERLLFADAAIIDVPIAHVPFVASRPVLKPALSIYGPLGAELAKRSSLAARPGIKLLVSRSSAPSRRLLNEDEVMDVLAPLGFQRVVLETLPLKDQVALFAAADWVVAPHGAGLANMAFLRPQSRVIEFLPRAMKEQRAFVYSRLSHLFGLRHAIVLCGAADEAGKTDHDYRVDIALMKAALDTVS